MEKPQSKPYIRKHKILMQPFNEEEQSQSKEFLDSFFLPDTFDLVECVFLFDQDDHLLESFWRFVSPEKQNIIHLTSQQVSEDLPEIEYNAESFAQEIRITRREEQTSVKFGTDSPANSKFSELVDYFNHAGRLRRIKGVFSVVVGSRGHLGLNLAERCVWD